jgi:ABC-type Fe3+/spermidine/putrescine transport system ATPase subunit
VARLLGIENLLPGTVVPGGISAGDVVIDADVDDLGIGAAVLWCVRPERVILASDISRWYPAVVVDVADLGASSAVTVRLSGGPEIRARTTERVEVLAQDACTVRIERSAISVWPDTLQPAQSRYANQARPYGVRRRGGA